MVMTTARPWKTAGLSGNRRSFSPIFQPYHCHTFESPHRKRLQCFLLDEPARSFVVLKRAKADEITCT